MPSLFTRFSIIGRLPKPLRAQLEPEGIIQRLKQPAIDQRWDAPNDVVASLPSRSLAFPVSADYVFDMIGVRARP